MPNVAFVYPSNIFVFSKILSGHTQQVQSVLSVQEEAGFTQKLQNVTSLRVWSAAQDTYPGWES